MIRHPMQQRLQSYYESCFPDKQDAQVTDLVNITAGWEHEMYSFDLAYGPTTDRRCESLVLRLYAGERAHESAEWEFHNMRRLRETGYPVPCVHILGSGSSVIDEPFVIMEKIQGKVLWQYVEEAPEEKRNEIHTLFCRLLVQLHGMDWRPFSINANAFDAAGPYYFVDAYLAEVRENLRQYSLPHLLPIAEWLQMRRDAVPCHRPSVIHNDFHYQNVMLRDDGTPAVIDWSRIRASDPRADLAFTLVLQRIYVSVELRDYLLEEYERLTGAKVEHLDWFETLSCLWRILFAYIVLSGGSGKIGVHSGAMENVKEDIDHFRLAYEYITELTGIEIPEMEKLFTSNRVP